MDFLEDVPEQIRNTVLFFLQDKSLDAVTKLCMLRGMGLEESVIQKASDYLDARPEEAAEEEGEKSDNDIEFVDFRDFLSDNRRTVANLLVEQKKWPELAKYIAVESDEAQEAFEAFMRRVEKENGQDHQEPRARTSEHDEISTETVSAAGHSASEGMKQKEEENFQKTNITYETPSVDQTPPPSINLRPGSLDSQKKNDSIENTKTNDSNNAETIQLMEKQMRAEMMAEMERQKIEEVERLVAQRLAEERLAEMEAKQEQMEADELKRQKKMEEVERLVAQKFEEEKRQKDLSEMEAKQRQMEADELKRRKEMEEVERLVAQKFEEQKRQKELSEMEAKQEQMEADELKRQKKMEEVERLVAQKFEEEKRQKELSEMEAKQEQMEADELKRQKEMEEVERLVAQKFEEEKHQKELSEMEAKKQQMETEELERQKKMEEVERLVAQRFEEEKRQKELSEMEAKQQMEADELKRQKEMEEVERLVAQKFEEEKHQKELSEMEAKKQQMKTEELERQKKMEEAERLVTQRLEEEKRQKELSEMKAKQQMETEELERQKKMEEAAKLEAEKREAENVDFYRDDDEPELVKEREEVKPEIDKLTKLINSKAQFTQDFPKVMNVLVLGETGVGKTTWINAFLNYFKYNTMNQARANGVEVLIPTKFTQLDKDLRKTVVEYSPTISSPDDQNVNEDWRTGESSTQQPKAYAFRVGPEDDQKIIRIIDTPGIGDRRGIEHDKLNFENILRFIADYPEIHAILILLKPNNAILNVVFRFCIFELLTHLHVSARKNIMFCFTNARQTLYSPGESMPALEQLMTDLQAKRGFRIPLEHKNVFCFDSESFRFLCAWGKGIRFSESEIADFAESWSISVEETFRLLDAIKELQPHQVQKTLSVNNVRSIVFALSRPIAEIFRNTEINRIKLEKKIIEVENLLEEKGNLAQLDLFVNQVSIHAKELDYPMTVCAGVNCTEKRKFTHRDEIERIVYKKECHTRCYLKGIKKGLFPNPLIKNCWCFGCGVHSERCSTCTCGWETHLHISYELVFTSEKVMDSRVKESLENNENKQKAAEMFVLTERKKLRDLEVLSKMLCEYCSEFAAFIHFNSLLPYNDVYLEYVDFLIREEDMKISNGASNSMRKRLIDHRQTYEQTVGHLLRAAANASPNQRSSKTTAEIMSMLEELKDLPKGGEFLREVERLEMLSVRQEQTNSVTNIKLRSPHFSNMM